MEVLFALAIVGTALFVLISAHQTALGLHISMEESIVLRSLLEQSVAQAEIGVLAGELSGGGDFGSRFPEYSWNYEALLPAEDSLLTLYQVSVYITGPDIEESREFFVFDGNDVEAVQPGSGASNNKQKNTNKNPSPGPKP